VIEVYRGHVKTDDDLPIKVRMIDLEREPAVEAPIDNGLSRRAQSRFPPWVYLCDSRRLR
jgi:hypothetical protein